MGHSGESTTLDYAQLSPPRVKAWAGNRIKLHYRRPTVDEQIDQQYG